MTDTTAMKAAKTFDEAMEKARADLAKPMNESTLKKTGLVAGLLGAGAALHAVLS